MLPLAPQLAGGTDQTDSFSKAGPVCDSIRPSRELVFREKRTATSLISYKA
jgi:hypothetical protein